MTLGAQMHFFAKDGYRGEQMRMADEGKIGKNKVWPEEPDAYFFADWEENYKDLQPGTPL